MPHEHESKSERAERQLRESQAIERLKGAGSVEAEGITDRCDMLSTKMRAHLIARGMVPVIAEPEPTSLNDAIRRRVGADLPDAA